MCYGIEFYCRFQGSIGNHLRCTYRKRLTEELELHREMRMIRYNFVRVFLMRTVMMIYVEEEKNLGRAALDVFPTYLLWLSTNAGPI